MDKVEKMHITDIMDMTNLYITSDSLLEIWKDSTETSDVLAEGTALDLFEQNPNLINELLENEFDMYSFLVEHDDEIDKPRFLMTILLNYKERLAMAGSINLDEEELENIKFGIKGIRTLLKGMDKTFVFYNVHEGSNKITDITVINSKEELEGIDRKRKNSNVRRLRELQKDTHLGNLVQALWLSDIEYVVPFEQEIGFSLRYAIEYNSMLDGTLDIPQELETEENRVTFIAEMARILEQHIEEVNLDKLLLCSAYRYMKELENNNIKPEEMYVLKERLDTIRKNIIKNVKIEVPPDEIYTIKELERDLKRFIEKEEDVTYISKEQEEKIIDFLLTGETELNELETEIINAIYIEPATLSQILKINPNNYILFLKQEKCAYNKKTIIQDIINTGICSKELLQTLCEKTDITPDEIFDLFDKEIISVGDLKIVREQKGTIITNSKLFEQYKKYRQKTLEGQDSELERIQLERYALAYRNTEILGKEESEVQEKTEEFITEVGDEIDSPDIMELYRFNIIPLKNAVDWGGEEIIEQLLEKESLKPADAKYLKNEGLLDEGIIEKIFKKCSQMSYAYQVSLVYAIFDGQTAEEQQIRETLAQYYHIEKGVANSIGNGHTGTKRNSQHHQDDSERKIKMRDPGAKYNLLAAIDNDVKIEEGIIDGHIIFHYPNIGNGTVLIEKLHRITSNKSNGLIEIRADNQSATYVLSEEEFIKIKSQLIKDGKVDRTELTQRWWITRDSEHWIPHTGTRGWEQALKERFLLDEENQRYTQADLVRIEQLLEKSIESKREER